MIIRLICFFALIAAAASAQNIAYTYDASGRLAVADYGNGTQIQYSYDNSGNLLSRTVVTGGSSDSAGSGKSDAPPSRQKTTRKTQQKAEKPAIRKSPAPAPGNQ